MPDIVPVPLAPAAFAPYGEVIAVPAGGAHRRINDGTCRRYDALAHIEVRDGSAGLSIFCAAQRDFPLKIALLERHPLGSQAFMPLAAARFIVVAAPDAGGAPDWENVQAFAAAPGQGVNFYRNVWHHPLIAIGRAGEFLVADRLGAEGGNLQEAAAPPACDLQVVLP